MRNLLVIALVLAVASPVFASGGAKKPKGGKNNRIQATWTIKNNIIPEIVIPDQGQATRSVDIPVVVAPISINGQLVNYAFLSIRVVLGKHVDPRKMRAKAPFMRDAVVRASHEQAFGKTGERSLLDKERTIELVRNAIKPWVTDAQLDHIEFLSIDMLNG